MNFTIFHAFTKLVKFCLRQKKREIWISKQNKNLKKISFTGQDLLDDHRFTVDCVQPKCSELRRSVQKLEVLLGEKRGILHKFLDLIDGIEAANKWSASALGHLERQDEPQRSSLTDEDVFSQIRQIDYLLSKSRELKLRSRREFEETFDELKEMLSPQTIFSVDDALDQLEAVTVKVMQKREELRSRATR